jgi:RNase P subunit RPR2
MDQRIYHGNITPTDIARNLMTYFHRGNLRVQQIGTGRQISVQIATHERARSGGQTALGISIQALDDGVLVQVGKQAWLGVAASLGVTAIAALRNPFTLLNRIDDLAQDIEHIKLIDEVWRNVEQTARALGTGHELSERLRRMICDYCTTPNPTGETRCIACGAPLGNVQPVTCKKCGFVVTSGEVTCPNCNSALT